MIILYGLLLAFGVYANELTPRAIYDSVNNYHPKLLENLLKVSEFQGKATAKQGSFDTTLEGEYFNRTAGYYDGDYLSTAISKPLASINSELYGGYRRGMDSHPVYDGNYLTGEGGRYVVGGEVNLFRNSKIYQDAIALTNSKMDVQKMQAMYNLIRMEVMEVALTKYWEWVAKGMQLKVYIDLLELAKTRQKAIESQVKHGDIANFYAIENQQYILQRTNKVQEMQSQFDIVSYQLSLYFRNAVGEMIPVEEKNLPTEMPNIIYHNTIENDGEYIKVINPALKAMQIELEQLENELKVAKAFKLPEASIGGEFYQDMGERDVTRQQARARIGVNFKMPLERNKGKGMTVEIESKKQQIRARKIMMENQLNTELSSIKNTMIVYEKMWHNAESEFDIASKLVKFERENVKHGNSDFFTLNLREQSAFQARVKSIEYHAYLNISHLKYHTILMKIDDLFATNNGK
ncbi:MAG: TolC family protein [Proteobacteria bacterium]|nr:TolC family protein [Pseudomonadota bacterium]